MSVGVPNKLRLVIREVLEEQCGQITILPEMKQVLHVQCIDSVLGVILYDLVGNEKWLVGVRSSQAVHGETAW